MPPDISYADAVADFFLMKQDASAGDSITPLKLQKLVYYAQAWHLAATRRKVFDEAVKAWKDGPVIPRLYHRFKEFDRQAIDTSAVLTDPFEVLQPSKLYVANEVFKELGCLNGSQLRKRTHDESPWKDAYGNRPEGARCEETIQAEAMASFYRTLLRPDFVYRVNIADAFGVAPSIEEVDGEAGKYLRLVIPLEDWLRKDASRRAAIEDQVHNVVASVRPEYVGKVAIRYRPDNGTAKSLSGICQAAA